MGWKNWPYWLRGGIIGLIIEVLAYPVFFLCLSNYDYICLIFLFPSSFIGPLVELTDSIGPQITMSTFLIINAIIVIILGIVIGWVIGKIKSRKKTSASTLQP